VKNTNGAQPDDSTPRHPVLKCTCSEGRIVRGTQIIWMPAVHDCLYIAEHNAARRAALAKRTAPGKQKERRVTP